jgi:hypothetical protein
MHQEARSPLSRSISILITGHFDVAHIKCSGLFVAEGFQPLGAVALICRYGTQRLDWRVSL